MVKSLWYWKVYFHWIVWLLTDEHRRVCMDMPLQLLQLSAVTSCWALWLVMKSLHKTTKHGMASQWSQNETKLYPWQEELWLKFSGLLRGAILVDFLLRKESVSAVCYVQTLQKLQCTFHVMHKMKRRIILQHGNEHLHNAHLTLAKVEEFGREMVLDPSYSLDLDPSYYQLFGPFKDHTRGKL